MQLRSKRLLTTLTALVFTATMAFSGALSGCAGHRHPVHTPSAAEVLAKGEAALARRDFVQAVTSFESLDVDYPFSAYSTQGQLDIIYAYYSNEDIPSALAAADRYIHLYPRGAHVDYAHYMKGLMHFLTNRNWAQKVLPIDIAARDLMPMKAAFFAFDELITRFPHSIYVQDAHRRMLYIRNLLANHELEVAQFYMRHKAYVAAANRASYLVHHFSQAPQVIDGLKVMIAANKALGNQAVVLQAQKILADNMPASSKP